MQNLSQLCSFSFVLSMFLTVQVPCTIGSLLITLIHGFHFFKQHFLYRFLGHGMCYRFLPLGMYTPTTCCWVLSGVVDNFSKGYVILSMCSFLANTPDWMYRCDTRGTKPQMHLLDMLCISLVHTPVTTGPSTQAHSCCLAAD